MICRLTLLQLDLYREHPMSDHVLVSDVISRSIVDIQTTTGLLQRHLLDILCMLIFRRSLRPLLRSLAPRMPQLTLSFDSPTKKLSLSPNKPKQSHLTISSKGQQPDLRRLHHEEEDMAAASKSRAKAQAEGKKVPMHDENDMGDAAFDREAGDGEGGKGKSEVKDEGRAKGVPTNKKRSRSPEGGGVAGRDSKKSKNAYEISSSPPFLVLPRSLIVRGQDRYS